MTDVPYLAPGCFGSAIQYRQGMVCDSCPFRKECEPAHAASLAALREKLGIKTPQVDTNKRKEVDPAVAHLPVKVRDLLEKIQTCDKSVKSLMLMGQNPFSKDTLPFMMVTCHLVLNLKETPITQSVISEGLQKSMKWKKQTADSHSRMALRALDHLGAIKEVDGVYTRPSS